MLRLPLAVFDGQSQRASADADRTRRFSQIHPAFTGAALCGVGRDTVVTAQRGHPLAGPEVTAAGALAIAVKHIGDEGVRADPGQRAHGIYRLASGVRGVLPASASRYAHLGVQAAL